MDLTQAVRDEARRLGADLVGFAPVSRWKEAPLEHSPLGLYAGARSAIVCGIHFLDASAELGSEEDPRKPGPALSQQTASAHLQHLAFRLCRFLQDHGQGALYVRMSGAWRYRADQGRDRGWVGDLCHCYAAAAAGLGEIGWNNLCLTPEYGPRQRFITVVTEAELTPTPLYRGPSLCDRCKLCEQHCPTDCFRRDRPDRMLSIRVEDRVWEFPERNLWRCAIGENFQLDVMLPEWRDTHVDEKLVIAMEEQAVTTRHDWVAGWKMGMCLKHCVPPTRRYFDRAYCGAPRRRRDLTPEVGAEAMERVWNRIVAKSREIEADFVGAVPVAALEAAGLTPRRDLPDAQSAVVMGFGHAASGYLNTDFVAVRAELWLGRTLQEEFGFTALARSEMPAGPAAVLAGLARSERAASAADAEGNRQAEGYEKVRSWELWDEREGLSAPFFGNRVVWRVLLASAPLPARRATLWTQTDPLPAPDTGTLTRRLRDVAGSAGADLVGIAPAARLEAARASLSRSCEELGAVFAVRDAQWHITGKGIWGGQAWPFNPQAEAVDLKPRMPGDLLPGARSVIVIGLRLLDASIDQVGRAPGNKAGHYHTSTHEESFNQLHLVLRALGRELERYGYRSVPSMDPTGLASRVAGGDVDLLASRFEAMAAGLGETGWNGMVLTPRFGARQRFACLVTDAELSPDEVYRGPALCRQCGACVKACPMQAIDRMSKVEVEIGGRRFQWGRHDRLRCDWAKRYGFIAAEGGCYIGCHNDFPAPQEITADAVCATMRDADRVQRPSYTPTVERCFTHCRAGRGDR